jgi:hypothetical protein
MNGIDTVRGIPRSVHAPWMGLQGRQPIPQDVLDYGEFDSGVRFVLIDLVIGLGSLGNCPQMSTGSSFEDTGRIDTRVVERESRVGVCK